MIAKTAAATGVSCRGLTTRLPARPTAAFKSSKRQVVVRFRDEDAPQTGSRTDTKLSSGQVNEVCDSL